MSLLQSNKKYLIYKIVSNFLCDLAVLFPYIENKVVNNIILFKYYIYI